MLFMICVFALQDVIEFISSEHAEGMLKMFYDYLLMNFIYSFRFKVHIFVCLFISVSEDQSYNEAAQTLLTIGNLSHVSQSEQNQVDIRDHVTG